MKVLRWTGIVVATLLLILAGTLIWIVGAPSGARWAVRTAAGVLGDRFGAERVEGTLAGPLVLEGVHYRDADAGIDIDVRRISIDLVMRRLLSATVEVRNAAIDGVRLDLTAAPPPEEEPKQPFRLEAPIDIVVRQFTLTEASIASEGVQVIDIDRAELAAQWVDESVSIERFDLRAPQGEIHFAGEVAQSEYFTGKGEGRFRWRQGGLLYAGTLSSDATDQRATLNARLTAPTSATLTASVEQRDSIPWQLQLDVPRFDPREDLMPDSAVQSLALALKGSGTQQSAEISGRLDLDGETILLEQIRVSRESERLTLDSRIRVAESEGALRLAGDVRFDAEPWSATLQANWDPLTIPKRWVGQDLATEGQLSVVGNTAKFRTQGALKLGPPKRQADIALDVAGSMQALEIQELTIKRVGELSARGSVQLAPSTAWRLDMQAKNFNPGVFLVQWPGDLAFALHTSGTIVEGVPSASLKLDGLRGRLRQRPISGDADLLLNEQRVLSGTMKVIAGQSRIELRGSAGDTLNVVATVDMPSLTDWIPDSEGRMQARVQARGKWPKLDIEARADGDEIRVADIHAAAVDVDVRAHDTTAISGTAQVDLRDLNAAGMNFRSLRARAEGSEADHVLTLSSEGDPLGADLRVQGGKTEGGWAGSIERLTLDVTKVARLALERPVRAELEDGAVRFSQACLLDANIRLCAAGASETDGSLQASYSLSGVPLGLAKVYAPADVPLDFSGTIEGAGDIRRTAQGELNGQAKISSAQGRIVATGHDDQTLLEYRSFQLDAQLDGPQAKASLTSEINQGGSLRGELSVNGLGEATTGLQGELSASMPSLATVALFVPQVANVQGRADVRVRVAGTMDAPQLSGELNATELGAHIPELGLHLRDGQVRATPQENGDIALAGEITSGDGKVTFDGAWRQTDQSLLVNVRGQSFLAADIPAAKVWVNPDLTFTREPTRMTLNGEVTLPAAKVDLQKMSRGGGPRAQQASPDVVVVDEPVIAAKRQDEAIPLFAEVTVVLGDKVELTGFGLNATVGGRLTIHEVPGEPTVGSGDISVAGTYKAYGQDLTIEQGHLLYARTAIDNPRLNIVAVRKIEDENVRAGLRIAGTARAPQITVFSDPAMGQAEALAYLVTGKPLDSVGAEDGDMMQTAARSLGTAAGGLLARRLGRRLGVDEVSIKESEVLEGAAFTVGEYLSPRLYLSYGVGLFEPGEVITLRYNVTKALALQALSGPEDMRAGVVWRVER